MSSRLVLVALFALAACSESTLPADEWVRASATGHASVAVQNRGSEPVYVRVIDPTELWQSIGCGPSNCLRVNPGQSVRVPYAEIINYTPGDAEAAVTWWLYADDAGSRTVHQGAVTVEL
jgi:hypothetical protein